MAVHAGYAMCRQLEAGNEASRSLVYQLVSEQTDMMLQEAGGAASHLSRSGEHLMRSIYQMSASLNEDAFAGSLCSTWMLLRASHLGGSSTHRATDSFKGHLGHLQFMKQTSSKVFRLLCSSCVTPVRAQLCTPFLGTVCTAKNVCVHLYFNSTTIQLFYIFS